MDEFINQFIPLILGSIVSIWFLGFLVRTIKGVVS